MTLGFTASIPLPRDNFLDRARDLVVDYFNEHAEKTDDFFLDSSKVYVVTGTYVLGNWKCLVSTEVNDGMYYEVTYNKEKKEYYVDAYKKWKNVCVKEEDFDKKQEAPDA